MKNKNNIIFFIIAITLNSKFFASTKIKNFFNFCCFNRKENQNNTKKIQDLLKEKSKENTQEQALKSKTTNNLTIKEIPLNDCKKSNRTSRKSYDSSYEEI